MTATAIPRTRRNVIKPKPGSVAKTNITATDAPRPKTLVEILRENDAANPQHIPKEVKQRITMSILQYLDAVPVLFNYELRDAIESCEISSERCYFDAISQGNPRKKDADAVFYKVLFRQAIDEVIVQKYYGYAVSLEVDASRFGKGVDTSCILLANLFYKDKEKMVEYLAGRLHEHQTGDKRIKKLVFR